MSWWRAHAVGLTVGLAAIACAQVTYITPRGLHVHDPLHEYEPEMWDRVLKAYEEIRPAAIQTDRLFVEVGNVVDCLEKNRSGDCVKWIQHDAEFHLGSETMTVSYGLDCGNFHQTVAHEFEHAYLDQEGRHPKASKDKDTAHSPPFDKGTEWAVKTELAGLCE